MFSVSYNIIYNISCSPSPAPGQALLGFHRNCCRSHTARAERRSSSSAAMSRRAAMSRIVRCDSSPDSDDVSFVCAATACQIVPHCSRRSRPKTRRCILVCAARSSRGRACRIAVCCSRPVGDTISPCVGESATDTQAA